MLIMIVLYILYIWILWLNDNDCSYIEGLYVTTQEVLLRNKTNLQIYFRYIVCSINKAFDVRISVKIYKITDT
jgi:hypothetical protein